MFKIAKSDRYYYPVTVEVVEDRGKRVKHTFDAQFVRLPQSEIDEMFSPQREQRITDSEVVDRVVVGWRGVKDQDDVDIPFSMEALADLLDVYGVRSAIVRAWMESLEQARQKN
jgi:hypothetical protein